jgi:hypothetical protein
MEAARRNVAERIGKIEQQRVLGRDNGGRGNMSEEGKDKNAKWLSRRALVQGCSFFSL